MMDFDKFKKTLTLFNEIEIHPHHHIEKSQLFQSQSFETTEIEYLDLLYGIVRSVKPSFILETGTFHGLSALVIACAIKANSNLMEQNKFITLEQDYDCYNQSKDLFIRESFDSFINVINVNSLEFLINLQSETPFDLVYFDSSRRTRIKEFEILKERSLLKKGAFLIFHDTSPYRIKSSVEESNIQNEYLEGLNKIQLLCESRLNFELSRGLTVFKY